MSVGRRVVTSLVLVSLPASAQAPQTESYPLSQCVVVQLGATPRLFITLASGDLQAVDVRTGTILWHTAKASVPLMARGNQLLALLSLDRSSQGWRLGVVDARTGVVLSRFPLWSVGRGVLGEGMGSFSSMEAFSVDGRDYVVLRSRWSHVSGAAGPPPPVNQATAAAEVDLSRATLAPVAREFADRVLMGVTDQPAGYHIGPFDVEGVTALAAREYANPGFRIVLHRRRGDEKLPDVVLCDLPRSAGNVEVSADRRHVLGGCRDSVTTAHYPGLVVSAVTGQQLGRLAGDVLPAAWIVWARRLVYYFPDRVGVSDLATAKPLYGWTVRDLRYHGTYPP